jgi:hypothetical protein
MANRKTFNDFKEEKPQSHDYVIGFSEPTTGGERRFRLSDLKGFMHPSEVIDVTGAIEFSHDDIISGKIYHITADTTTNEVITVSLPHNPPTLMQFAIVNTTDQSVVKVVTRTGSELQANGNLLRKKHDTAIIYWNGSSWYAYGDLSRDGGVNIKNITNNHHFNMTDADSMLHVNSNSNVDIILPNPVGILSGTQFYVYNMSETSIVTLKSDEVELSARSNSLRKQYDDAVVYTDGEKWFATGDLS